MPVRVLQFIAIILTALALVPGGAHLLELANKTGLDRDSYFTVQQIYRGWALLGIILIAAGCANGCAACRMRHQPKPAALALLATVLMCVSLAIFFTWTFPVNQATSNWTVALQDWQSLRAQWEYSHAANCVVVLLALCSTTAAALVWSR